MDIPAEEFQKLQERLDVVLDHILRDKTISDIARERGTSQPTIRKWIKWFEADGLHGLLDRKRSSGRPRKIPQGVRNEIIRLTLETRPPHDLGEDRLWTTRLLAELSGISASHIANIWREAGIDPRLHLQQVERNPDRMVPLRVDLLVPAWLKLNLQLRLEEHGWTLEEYVLARLVGEVGLDPDRQEPWEELRESALETLAHRWSETFARIPVEDPRTPEYRRELKQRMKNESRSEASS